MIGEPLILSFFVIFLPTCRNLLPGNVKVNKLTLPPRSTKLWNGVRTASPVRYFCVWTVRCSVLGLFGNLSCLDWSLKMTCSVFGLFLNISLFGSSESEQPEKVTKTPSIRKNFELPWLPPLVTGYWPPQWHHFGVPVKYRLNLRRTRIWLIRLIVLSCIFLDCNYERCQ